MSMIYEKSIRLNNGKILSLHIVTVLQKDPVKKTLIGSVNSYTSNSVLECLKDYEEPKGLPPMFIRNNVGVVPVKTTRFVIENFTDGVNEEDVIKKHLNENLETVILS